MRIIRAGLIIVELLESISLANIVHSEPCIAVLLTPLLLK